MKILSGEELREKAETIRQKTIEEIKALNVGTSDGSIIIPLKSWKDWKKGKETQNVKDISL